MLPKLGASSSCCVAELRREVRTYMLAAPRRDVRGRIAVRSRHEAEAAER